MLDDDDAEIVGRDAAGSDRLLDAQSQSAAGCPSSSDIVDVGPVVSARDTDCI